MLSLPSDTQYTQRHTHTHMLLMIQNNIREKTVEVSVRREQKNILFIVSKAGRGQKRLGAEDVHKTLRCVNSCSREENFRRNGKRFPQECGNDVNTTERLPAQK